MSANEMRTYKKTYGVRDKMEFLANVDCGEATLKINFTGGAFTTLGTTPATFTTENACLQAMIERSHLYKRGVIYLVRKYEIKNSKASNATHIDHTPKPTNEAEGNATTEVEFETSEQARDYLEKNFDASRSKLTNRKQIVEFGLTKGVNIHFIK